jgi:predicted phage tail protein
MLATEHDDGAAASEPGMTGALREVHPYGGLREVRLYGSLGRRFGRVHRLAVATAGEAVMALTIVLPGFAAYLREHSEPGYHVFAGQRAAGRDLGAEQLLQPVSAREPILIVPVVAGAKRGGALQSILGAVLIGLSVFNPLGLFAGSFAAFSGAGSLGTYLLLGGVAQMAFGPQRTSSQQRIKDEPSKNFDGPTNTDAQGGPVPVRFGRVICGGVRVSAGITTDEVYVAAAGSGGSGGMTPQPLPAEQPLDPIRDNLKEFIE